MERFPTGFNGYMDSCRTGNGMASRLTFATGGIVVIWLVSLPVMPVKGATSTCLSSNCLCASVCECVGVSLRINIVYQNRKMHDFYLSYGTSSRAMLCIFGDGTVHPRCERASVGVCVCVCVCECGQSKHDILNVGESKQCSFQPYRTN